MELVFRIRPDRLDRHGRATITADIHWSSAPVLRLNQLPTGVKVRPENWQPGKTKFINTREEGALTKNLELSRFSQRINQLFTVASGAGQAESSLRAADLKAAVAAPAGEAAPAPPPAEQTLADLHQRWQQENPGPQGKPPRRYGQVLGHLDAFQKGLRLDQLTRRLVADYRTFTQGRGVADSTFRNHVKFLREAYRTAGLHPPAYLKLTTPDSRPLSLTLDELRQLIDYRFAAAQRPLADERDCFVLQTLLLLRDSDLRRLRAGYVKQMPLLVGQAPVLVAGMPQQKTAEELAIPFSPLAAGIWERHAGRLPVVAQQNRNSRMKEMAAAVGLTREVVKVRWVNGRMLETTLPLYQALTSHAARHTGADMLLVGSGGDRNLVEIGLGHVSYTYGHDSIYRYGPQLLAAWAAVLADLRSVGSGQICQRPAAKSVANPTTMAA